MGYNIWCIEDAVTTREMIKDAFTERGHNFTGYGTFRDFYAAHNSLGKMGCDVVVLDLFLEEGVNVLEFIEMIKKMKENVPIVIYSGHPREMWGEKSIKSGASLYVEKQARPDELVEIVEALIKPNE